MSYQNQIATTLARLAEEDRERSVRDARASDNVGDVVDAAMIADRARRLDNLAVQFWNCDYDNSLMADYAALAENADLVADLAAAADEVMAEISCEDDDYLHPDDLLREVVRRTISE